MYRIAMANPGTSLAGMVVLAACIAFLLGYISSDTMLGILAACMVYLGIRSGDGGTNPPANHQNLSHRA